MSCSCTALSSVLRFCPSRLTRVVLRSSILLYVPASLFLLLSISSFLRLKFVLVSLVRRITSCKCFFLTCSWDKSNHFLNFSRNGADVNVSHVRINLDVVRIDDVAEFLSLVLYEYQVTFELLYPVLELLVFRLLDREKSLGFLITIQPLFC